VIAVITRATIPAAMSGQCAATAIAPSPIRVAAVRSRTDLVSGTGLIRASITSSRPSSRISGQRGSTVYSSGMARCRKIAAITAVRTGQRFSGTPGRCQSGRRWVDSPDRYSTGGATVSAGFLASSHDWSIGPV